MILQLNPSIPLETPLGSGDAWFFEDDGQEIFWTVAIRDTGAIVQFKNEKVRARRCYTAGRCVTDSEMLARTSGRRE